MRSGSSTGSSALGFGVTVTEKATQPTCPIDFRQLLWFHQN
jgi:hypothetical protein